MDKRDVQVNRERLAELIEEKYGSQLAFAKECGFTRQFISGVLKGTYGASSKALYVFSRKLGVPMEELLIGGKAPALAPEIQTAMM